LLEGGFAAFVVADADGFFDAADEDLAVADATGAGCGADGVDGFVFHFVGDDEFDFDLGKKVDGVFATAVELGVTLLAAVAAGFQNRHAFDAGFEQRIFDCIQLGRLKNRFDLEHMQMPRLTAYQAEPRCVRRGA